MGSSRGGTEALEAECSRLCRYLTGADPDPQVRTAYATCIERFPDRFAAGGGLDDTLATALSAGWVPIRMIDIVARHLAPAAAVRRRLVLLLALLENDAATFEWFDQPGARSPAGFAAGLLGRGLVSAAALVGGLILMTPWHMARALSR